MRKNVEEREQPIRPIRQRAIDHLAKETMATLAREKVFPKRTRWQYAESLARLVNIADSLSNIADGIKPTNRTEYAIRHLLNVLTVAVLTALDAKMTQAMREERRTLDGMKRLLDRGELTIRKVKQHYQSWIANAEYCGDAPIRAMDKYYTMTFRRKPNYKRKRRYLYGIQNERKRAPVRSGKGKPYAAGAAGKGVGRPGVRRHDDGRGHRRGGAR